MALYGQSLFDPVHIIAQIATIQARIPTSAAGYMENPTGSRSNEGARGEKGAVQAAVLYMTPSPGSTAGSGIY